MVIEQYSKFEPADYFENPGKYFGLGGNNHHCVFSFKDHWYNTVSSDKVIKY